MRDMKRHEHTMLREDVQQWLCTHNTSGLAKDHLDVARHLPPDANQESNADDRNHVPIYIHVDA